jgi:hypothetical protein
MFGPLFSDHQEIQITAVRITEGPQCTYQDLKTCIFIIISFYFEYSLIIFLHDMYNKKKLVYYSRFGKSPLHFAVLTILQS